MAKKKEERKRALETTTEKRKKKANRIMKTTREIDQAPIGLVIYE